MVSQAVRPEPRTHRHLRRELRFWEAPRPGLTRRIGQGLSEADGIVGSAEPVASP